MDAWKHWMASDAIADGMAVLAMAVVLGLFIGSIRVRGVKLGIPGVIFGGLIFGQLGFGIDPAVLAFLRNFALILFMYAIGLQVGPGFVSSLRADGLRLNVLSVAVLVIGCLLSAIAGIRLADGAATGVFTGSFTTTASLAAAQEALRHSQREKGEDAAAHAGLVYSITYPFGAVGPIIALVIVRKLFRVDIEAEKQKLMAEEEKRRPPITVVDFEVTNPQHAGKLVREINIVHGTGIVFVRLLRDHTTTVPTGETVVQIGDVYRAVGPRVKLLEVAQMLGRVTKMDWSTHTGDVKRSDFLVTNSQVLRKTLRELDFIRRTGVTISRINRAGIELSPSASLRLGFGDRLTAVGPEAGLKVVEKEVGNCPETLDRSQLVPIFLGIALGVAVGSIPLFLPGLGTALKIGLAGGPLIAAIALSQLGSIGSIVWYMPTSANQLFRDFGLAVFLVCVGLKAGDHFVQRTAANGMEVLVWNVIVTILPVVLVGCFARIVLKYNFLTVMGLMSGSMTSTPALLFATESTKSNAPAVAYAAVAPLGTLLPILFAQVLAVSVHGHP
jgi:putative transport protein